MRALLCVPLVLSSGCDLFTFGITEPIPEQRIEGSFAPNALGQPIPMPFAMTFGAQTPARDTGPADHVLISAIELRITSTAEPVGDTDDFDFLDSMSIYVESALAGTTLPRQRIATITSPPPGARTLSLDIDGVDIIDYVNEGARLTAEASGSFPPDDVTFDGEVRLVVKLF